MKKNIYIYTHEISPFHDFFTWIETTHYIKFIIPCMDCTAQDSPHCLDMQRVSGLRFSYANDVVVSSRRKSAQQSKEM